MDRADYEWRYFIGGDCALTRRKYQGLDLARIKHVEQGVYEAIILRNRDPNKLWSLGIYYDSDEAQEVIEQALEPLWEK